MGNLLSGEEELLDATVEEATVEEATEPKAAEKTGVAKRKRRGTPAVIEVDAYAEPALPAATDIAPAIEEVPALPTKDSESISGAVPAEAAATVVPVCRTDKRFQKTYRRRRSAATTRKNTSAL
jgi:hypothetical protein